MSPMQHREQNYLSDLAEARAALVRARTLLAKADRHEEHSRLLMDMEFAADDLESRLALENQGEAA